MASRVRLLWKLASRLPKEVQGNIAQEVNEFIPAFFWEIAKNQIAANFQSSRQGCSHYFGPIAIT